MSGETVRMPWEVEPFAVVDGGLSTALEESGEQPKGLLWTAEALLDRPHVLEAAHRAFVEAGADVVISASYQASVPGLVVAGLGAADARLALGRTTELARASGARWVASSVGPYGAYLADGSEYRGDYVTSGAATWEEIRAFHRERLEVLVDSGPDLFAIETIPLAVEAEIVVEELRRLTDTPAWVTFSCRDGSTTCGGDDAGSAAQRIAEGVQAVGLNCTAPAHVDSLLGGMNVTGLPLVTYPNHGATWDAEQKCWVGPTGGLELAGMVARWHQLGARLVGGCCGVGTAGVAALSAERDRLRGRPAS
ncbi:MAG: homocysteine S-methyltransferase [Ilumatobacteraceae bacterium]|jgi:homocysteine S-methyltransferase